MKLSSKNRGLRALVVTGVAGLSLGVSAFAGSIAESAPMGSQSPCYPENEVPRQSPYCPTPTTRNTLPPNQTSSTVPAPTTSEPAPTTTEAPEQPTTTAGPTTTAAPGSSTTTTAAVAGAGGAVAARPIAGQAAYTG